MASAVCEMNPVAYGLSYAIFFFRRFFMDSISNKPQGGTPQKGTEQFFYTAGREQVIEHLQSTHEGLSTAQAEERLTQYGKNALREGKKKSLLARFFAQFKDAMIIILLIAALVSGAISIWEGKPEELFDSGIILLIVIINAVIGLIQENKAESAMEALKGMNKPFSKVYRNGKVETIPSDQVVPGDVVQLDAGDMVPADMRILTSASLQIEESALTGESVPSEKHADAEVKAGAPLGDRKNMAYSGSTVTYGRGTGIVTATGMKTEVGKIADMLSEDDNQATPLQKQLSKTAKVLSIIILVIAAVIFAVTALRDPSVDNIIASFMTAVAIAVAAIPEGLPAVVTIVLSMGMQKMSKRNAIVKNLPAVETLGCCQIICSDKTGTLTLNRMTVKELYYDASAIKAEDALHASDADVLVRTLALCNDTVQNDDTLVGDPTETALVRYAIDRGAVYADLLNEWKRVDELPFDSVRKMMTTVNRNATTGQRVAHVKGAPDLLLAHCTSAMINGKRVPMSDELRADIVAANKAMADKALRVLAAAVKEDVPVAQNDADKAVWETDLTFVGLVGMIDPPRPEVKDAVSTCKRAGMRPIMITGDHKDTAAAIAREIGILDDKHKVMEGVEIDRYSDEEFAKIIEDYAVFARVSPENKVKIVRVYKSLNKVVAMTGDGVNDAPSIKRADIGIGMGITGTDVSKGAADMVLADDNFATIIGAVEEGRKLYDNIKKATQYLLSANIAEVLCLFIVSVILGGEFLTPVMILWINLVTDSLPALSLGMESAERDVMAHQPRKNGGSLFSGETGINIFIQGFMQTGLVLASYFLGDLVLGNEHIEAMTMAFLTLCFIQLFHSFNMKSFHTTLFTKKMFANKWLNVSFIVGALLSSAVVLIPGLNTLFDTAHINLVEWGVALGCAVMIIPLVEIQKAILRAREK